MSVQDCIDEIKRAAGRDLTDDELDDLLTELQRRARERKITASAEGLDEAVLRAADDYAAQMAEQALIEKRNAAISLKTRLEALDYIRTQFAGKEGLGIEAVLTGVNRPAPGARASVAAEQNQLTNYYLGGFMSDIEVAGLRKEFASGVFDRDIARALRAKEDNIGPPPGTPDEAIRLAEMAYKWQEVVRQDANRAGAWIKKLPGYIVRQSHDAYKISSVGPEAWKAAILPKLDPDRTFQGQDPDKFLDAVYKTLSDGEHLQTRDAEPTGFKGPSNIAKRVSAERTLHFKSADDWFDYNKDFGVGNFREALLRGFEWHAQSTGLMRKLGPNPGANLNQIIGTLRKSDIAISRTEEKTALDSLKTLDGTTRMAVNKMSAQIASTVRVGENMAKLGGAVMSQLGDIPVYAAEMSYQGRGFLSSMGEAVAGLLRGRNRREMAEIDGGIGILHEGTRGDIAGRFSLGNDAMPGAVAKAQQLFFKLNLMQWWQDSLRATATRWMSHRLALNRDLSFAGLHPDLQRVLSLFNIDDKRWDVIRSAATKEADGRQYVVTDTILELPDEAVADVLAAQGKTLTPARARAMKREIADQLRSYYVDRSGYAVLEPDQRVQTTMLRGHQPGTVEGEMLRFFGQFKSFAIGTVQKTLGREIYGRGANTLGEALRNGNGEMLGVAQLMLWGAAFGYAAMTAKDLIKGRTPRDPTNPKTWFAALAQGGGGGIYGDFLFGEIKSRFGHNLATTAIGPAAGTAADIFDVIGRLREGDDVAAAAFRTGLNNTPFMNLFYTRIVMDYLFLYQIQESLNPGSLRRMERRIEKENDQTFLVRPSQWVR